MPKPVTKAVERQPMKQEIVPSRDEFEEQRFLERRAVVPVADLALRLKLDRPAAFQRLHAQLRVFPVKRVEQLAEPADGENLLTVEKRAAADCVTERRM